MVGSSNECDIMIEDIECKALLDTGSCVSTLSHSFYDSHFKHIRGLSKKFVEFLYSFFI